MSDYHLNLYWHQGRGCFVISDLVGGQVALPDFYRQDRRPIRLRVVDNDPESRTTLVIKDLADYDIVVGIGHEATAAALAENNSTFVWNPATKAFEGVLNLYTIPMEAALTALSTTKLAATFYFTATNGPEVTDDCITALAACEVRKVIKLAASGLPEDITSSQFADLLESCVQDTNSVGWTRSGNRLRAAVRRKTSGGIFEDADGLSVRPLLDEAALFSSLSVLITAGSAYAASPTVDADTVVMGGVAGKRYAVRVKVAIESELKAIAGGAQRSTDSPYFYRGGTWAVDGFNKLTLSDGTNTYALNKLYGSSAITTATYYADIIVISGATLTLRLDSVDGLMLGAPGVTQSCTVELDQAEELDLSNAEHAALAGITGVVQTRLNALEAKRLDEWAAPADNTDTNVSTGAHGLTPKLPGDATQYLDGNGNWSAPGGAGAFSLATTVTRGQNYDVLHKRVEGVMTARTTGTTPTVLSSLLSLWSAFPDTNPNSVYPSGVVFFDAEVVAHRSGAGTLERAVWKLSGVAEIDTETISFPEAITKDLVTNSFTGGTPDAEFYTNGVGQIGIRATGLNDGSTKFTVWTAHVSLLLSAADKSLVI